jgi:hypothetical protein
MKAIKSIANWVESSNYDIKTADHMFESRRYFIRVLKWLKKDERLKK